MSEEQQLATLAQLAALLENVWFKHLIAVWQQDLATAREAVCEWPLKDIPMLISCLHTRGEASALKKVINYAYDAYKELTQQKDEKEYGTRNTDND